MKKPLKRALSWSEDQINKLQHDNTELRQKIIDLKRAAVEKDQSIAILTQQNAQYKEELDRKNDMIQFANSIIVTVQDFQETQSRESANSSNYEDMSPSGSRDTTGGDEFSDIIRIYGQI